MAQNVTIRNISNDSITTRTGQPPRRLGKGEEAIVDLDDRAVREALASWQGYYIVITNDSIVSNGPQVYRSGVLNFADANAPPESDAIYFEDVLREGAVLIKAFAVFDFNLNWTGGGAPKLELTLVPTDGAGTPSLGNGIEVATYDLNDGWPSGSDSTGVVMTEFAPQYTVDEGDANITLRNYKKREPFAGTVVGAQAGLQATHGEVGDSVTRTAGTYEVLSLIQPPVS